MSESLPLKQAKSQSHRPWKGALLISVSTLFFTLMALGIRLAREDLRSDVLVFYRGLIQVLFFLPWWKRFLGVHHQRTLRERLPFHLLRGLLGLGAMMCLFRAIQLVPLAMAQLIGMTAVLWAALMARTFLKESFNSKQMVYLAVIAAGLVLAVSKSEHSMGWQVPVWGVCLAVLGSVLRGGAMTVIRKISQEMDSQEIIFFFGLSLLLGATPGFVWSPQMPQNLEQGLWVMMVGLCGVGGQYFLVWGSAQAPALLTSSVTMLGMLWSLLLGFVFLGEYPPAIFYLGAVFVLCGIVGLILLQVKTGKPSEPQTKVSH